MSASTDTCQSLNQENKIEATEGLLYKYTNVVKGWQYRWFVLNPSRGTLEYYMPDEKKKIHPRGCIFLAGSVLAPSEEDSQTFIVSSACGETYKLKAANANERQIWVNKLRQVAQIHQTNIECTTNVINNRAEIASSLSSALDILIQTQKSQRSLVASIENYTCIDEDLLTLKALSNSTIMALEQCFVILNSFQRKSHSRRSKKMTS